MSALGSIIAPFSWQPAIELGNRVWAKRLLPIGEINYQGRTLKFTRDYIEGLVHAFQDQAYDQVAFQLADGANTHTNDPERFRGEIVDMQAHDDGLWLYLQPTEAGDRVLRENPKLGVSARIVEQYARSDGKFYPAAIQHVLGTLDPRIPQLGAWQPIDMANEAALVIDLSQSAFPGEDELTDQELADLMDAMADDTDDELAAWVDSLSDAELAELEAEALSAGEQDGYAQEELAAFGAEFSNYATAMQDRTQARADADELDRTRPARRDEDILARALGRASRGILTSEAALAGQQAAISLSNSAGLCGSGDPVTGRCSARYHMPNCRDGYLATLDAGIELARSGAYDAALDRLAVELAGDGGGPRFIETTDPYGGGSVAVPARTLELAHELNESWGLHGDTASWGTAPGWEELTGQGYRGDAYGALASELGLAGAQQPQHSGHPNVSGLARELGLK